MIEVEFRRFFVREQMTRGQTICGIGLSPKAGLKSLTFKTDFSSLWNTEKNKHSCTTPDIVKADYSTILFLHLFQACDI